VFPLQNLDRETGREKHPGSRECPESSDLYLVLRAQLKNADPSDRVYVDHSNFILNFLVPWEVSKDIGITFQVSGMTL
jgi:hypothetical protein